MKLPSCKRIVVTLCLMGGMTSSNAVLTRAPLIDGILAVATVNAADDGPGKRDEKQKKDKQPGGGNRGGEGEHGSAGPGG